MLTIPLCAFMRDADAVRPAAQKAMPKEWLEQISWERLQIYLSSSPNKMHIHVFANCDVSADKDLVVKRAGWNGTARDPQTCVDLV